MTPLGLVCVLACNNNNGVCLLHLLLLSSGAVVCSILFIGASLSGLDFMLSCVVDWACSSSLAVWL